MFTKVTRFVHKIYENSTVRSLRKPGKPDTVDRKGGDQVDQIKTGGLIRQLRLKQGMTQRQLAEAVGVSDKAVSKWERGLSLN